MSVQSFILKVVNNSCPEMKALMEGPRTDTRVNLTMVVLVIPVNNGKLQLPQTFPTVTMDFSLTGVGIVLDKQHSLDEVILGVRWEKEMTYLRAKAKHLSPMGGGFYRLGLEMVEIVPASKYPQLNLARI